MLWKNKLNEKSIKKINVIKRQEEKQHTASLTQEKSPGMLIDKSEAVEALWSQFDENEVIGAVAPVTEVRQKRPDESKEEKQRRQDADRQEILLLQQWEKLQEMRKLMKQNGNADSHASKMKIQLLTAELKYLSMEELTRNKRNEYEQLPKNTTLELQDRLHFLQKKLSILTKYAKYADEDQKDYVQIEMDATRNSIHHCADKLQGIMPLQMESEGELERHSRVQKQEETRLDQKLRKEQCQKGREELLQKRQTLLDGYEKQRKSKTGVLSQDNVYSLLREEGAGALNYADVNHLEENLDREGRMEEIDRDEIQSLGNILAVRCKKKLDLLSKDMLQVDYCLLHVGQMDEIISCVNSYYFFSRYCEEHGILVPELMQYQQNMIQMANISKFAEMVWEANGFHTNCQNNSHEDQLKASAGIEELQARALRYWNVLEPIVKEERNKAEQERRIHRAVFRTGKRRKEPVPEIPKAESKTILQQEKDNLEDTFTALRGIADHAATTRQLKAEAEGHSEKKLTEYEIQQESEKQSRYHHQVHQMLREMQAVSEETKLDIKLPEQYSENDDIEDEDYVMIQNMCRELQKSAVKLYGNTFYQQILESHGNSDDK